MTESNKVPRGASRIDQPSSEQPSSDRPSKARKLIEQRSCAGCRTVRDKSELIRCVRSVDGSVSIDRTGKAQGRGAYLCPRLECLAKAKKKDQLGRVLRTSVGKGVYAELEHMIRAAE